MGCMCIQRLQAIGTALKNLPLAMLAKLAADQLGPLNQAARLAPSLYASLSETASAKFAGVTIANATASAAANVAANLNVSASAMASLEALAAVNSGLGMGTLNPSVAGKLRVMIKSVNLQAPDMLAALNEFLDPVAAAIDRLQALAASLQGITAISGMNLAVPRVVFPPFSATAAASVKANVSAMAAAQANFAATARIAGSATATASARGMLALRLQAASMALGFALPQQTASINSALALTNDLPRLELPQSLLQSVSSKLSTLAATMSTLGVNLVAPGGANHLLTALQAANMNLQAMASADLSAMAKAIPSAAASVAASAAAKLNANAILDSTAKLNLSIPNLQPLATSLAMAVNLNAISGTSTFASRPCSSCKMF